MPAKKYRVRLSEEERQELKGLVSRGRTAAYRQTHARILLLSDEVQGPRLAARQWNGCAAAAWRRELRRRWERREQLTAAVLPPEGRAG